MTKRVTRRDFLLFVSGTAGAFLVSCRPANPQSGETPVPTPVPPTSAGSGSKAAEPTDFSALDPNYGSVTVDKEPVVTATDEFFTQAFSTLEAVDINDWTLVIDGLVEKPLTFTYDDILALDSVTKMWTLECIGNPVGGELIGNATWTGVPIKPLLDEAGILDDAIRARFYAADDYTTAVDLEWITQEGTLLVYAMNGEPLDTAHGFPLRILMPGLYGQKMPKWITRIELIDNKFKGFWEQHGWSDIADVQTNSKIELPENMAQITGTFAIQGWAYAGKRRITKVEVQIDDGEWIPCELLEGSSALVWTQWWTAWTPQRTGSFNVAVRATDEDEFVQGEEDSETFGSAFPGGTSAIHSVDYNAKAPKSD